MRHGGSHALCNAGVELCTVQALARTTTISILSCLDSAQARTCTNIVAEAALQDLAAKLNGAVNMIIERHAVVDSSWYGVCPQGDLGGG